MDATGHDILEIAASVILALATVASAWCAYQAAIWNGEQLQRLADASAAQFNSVRELSVLSRKATIDVETFINYAIARLHEDTRVAQFLRAHARPEFSPAIESWIA